jgi:hypothetical protein
MHYWCGTAQAEKIVIKRGGHGHHYGWRHHHRHATKIVIKRGHRHTTTKGRSTQKGESRSSFETRLSPR